MTATTELLSADELLHLAMEATDRSHNGQAIEYLRRLLALRPDSADAHYLLGAQLAQIGLLEQGADSMARALALRPDMVAARFQLGMVLTSCGRIDEAERVWLALDELDASHPFRLFKTGLLHVSRDQFAQGLVCLEQGMATNRLNAPLNEDMATVVRQVRALMDGRRAVAGPGADATGHAPGDAANEAPAMDVPPMFLDAYNTGKAH